MHLEDVEETPVKDEISDETGHTEVLCTYGGKQMSWMLVYIVDEHGQQSLIKRNTGTQGSL